MPNRISAGVLEDIEREDDADGWSDGDGFVLSPTDRAAFDVITKAWAYKMPDDEDDACPVCEKWTCSCVRAT